MTFPTFIQPGPNDGMSAALYAQFCQIAYDRAGIDLKGGKEALVSTRIAKRLRTLGLETAQDYLRVLKDDTSGEELVQFLDVISTNFTSFFREEEHFRLLHDVITEGLRDGQNRFRFWSAACSTGEEPYTMGITLLETLQGKKVDCKILATDISTRVLAKAKAGFFEGKSINDIPGLLRHKYFFKSGRRGSDSDTYEIHSDIKDMIIFKRLNLAAPPYPMSGPLDMIFCRNVMIYFDQKVRQNLVSECERLLAPHGLLVIGHTETLTGLQTGLRIIRPSIYRLEG